MHPSTTKSRFVVVLLFFLIAHSGLAQYPSAGGLRDASTGPSGESFYTLDSIGSRLSGNSRIGEVLQGRVPGLEVIEQNGLYSSAFQMILEGYSFSELQRPMIFIDGVSLRRIPNRLDFSTDLAGILPLSLNDIESIEIISGPASLLMAGENGMDGIISIRTKKNLRKKFWLEYGSYASLQLQPRHTELLSGDQYIMYQLEALHNTLGVFEVPDEISYNKYYEDFHNYSANTDWIGEVTRTGLLQNHYLNLSAGSEKIRYNASFDFLDKQENLIHTAYRQFITRQSLDFDPGERISLGAAFTYASDRNRDNAFPESTTGKNYDLFQMAHFVMPNRSVMEYDENGVPTGDYFTPPGINYQGSNWDYYNPVAASELGNREFSNHYLLGEVRMGIRFSDWLSLNENVSFQSLDASQYSMLPMEIIDNLGNYEDQYLESELYQSSHRFRNACFLGFSAPMQNSSHDLSADLGFIYSAVRDTWAEHTNWGSSESGLSENKLSALLSARYIYGNRYELQAGMRREAKSVKEEANYFAGAGGTWYFSREPWLENQGWLNESRLFLEWGRFSNMLVSGKGGLDVSLMDHRIHLMTSVFSHHIASHSPAGNYYDIDPIRFSSQGWISALSVELVRARQLSWKISLNINHNSLVLIDHDENLATYRYPYNTYVQIAKGEEMGALYGLDYMGVYSILEDTYARDEAGILIPDGLGNPFPVSFQGTNPFEAGDARYRDVDYNGVIGESDLLYLGNSYPEFNGGVGTFLRYRNISLHLQFHYRTGHKIINQVARDMENLSGRDNQSIAVLDRWRVSGQDDPGMLPRACLYSQVNNLSSDRFVESGSFLSLNYLYLGYDLDKGVCSRLRISGASIYFSARNLFTLTSYSGLNPEVPRDYSNLFWSGSDEIRMNPARALTIGIRLEI